MATDVEEPDTDEHERPVPPKRQCKRFPEVNETWNTEQHTDVNMETVDDNAEKHAREKLKRWQAFQAARGSMDNTVNKVLEDMMSQSERLDRHSIVNSMVSRLCLFRGNYTELSGIPLYTGDYMEDTAVMMAIRNHGLVKSAKLVSQSHYDKAPSYKIDSESIGVHCSSPSNYMQDTKDLSCTLPTTSSDSLKSSNSIGMGRCNMSDPDADKVYNSDQPEDFLERAVAEAIKKKGLSALSVLDY